MPKIYFDEYQSGMYRNYMDCEQGENLYEVLVRNGVLLPGAVCKGAGVCRGCQVYIAEEDMECLACRYFVEAEVLHIVLDGKLTSQNILLTDEVQNGSEPENKTYGNRKETGNLGIAFDIGTTTIASALIDIESGERLSQAGCLNRQARFGADVVSRIDYASGSNPTPKGLQTMHDCIKADIEALIQYYTGLGYQESKIVRLVFSGNTTMIHFLLHLSVQGMAAYPFTPERLSGSRYQYKNMEIIILPGKSAFVGGDIVSGIRYLELGKKHSYELLIDLGTNGELWLLNQERGVCTSTSCGPAFVNSVTKGNLHGTSLIDELAKAYQEGKVDSTGLLQGAYFERGISVGKIMITQDTIRQVQLAKAAIRTGIELVAYELRLPLADIAHIYLAGGFGFYLNLESAYTIGLFPQEFRGKVELVGNTSLFGAIRALMEPDDMLQLPKALEESMVMDLSMNKNFQEFFLHHIEFPTTV